MLCSFFFHSNNFWIVVIFVYSKWFFSFSLSISMLCAYHIYMYFETWNTSYQLTDILKTISSACSIAFGTRIKWVTSIILTFTLTCSFNFFYQFRNKTRNFDEKWIFLKKMTSLQKKKISVKIEILNTIFF